MKYTLTVILATAILVGCAPLPRPANSPATVTSAPAVASPTVAAIATAPPKPSQPEALETPATNPSPIPAEQQVEDIAITLRREGGIAGRRDLWTIYNSGRVETNKGETRQIGGEAVTALLQEVAAAGFFDLQDRYVNEGCADCYEYTVTVNGQGKSKTVQINDAGKAPDSLRQLIDKIMALAGNAQ